MSVDAYLEKMKSGAVSTTSKLGIRNEDKQEIQRGGFFSKLKKEKKKKAKLAILTELAIPFDPMTCEENENGNRTNKFRVDASQTTLMLSLKKLYNDDAELKAKFLNKVGASEWDTSQQIVTEQDRDIFAKYRVPRIFSFHTIGVNMSLLTGVKFQKDYQVDIERDELGNIVVPEGKEYPLLLSANKFFRELYYQEYAKWESENEDAIDTQKTDKRGDILGKNPIKSDKMTNYYIGIEMAIDSSFAPETDINDLDDKAIRKSIVLIKETKAFKVAFNKFSDAWKVRDIYNDFKVVDMTCPNDPKDNLELGMQTTFEREEVKLQELNGFAAFNARLCEAIDGIENLEVQVARSAGLPKWSNEEQAKLPDAISATYQLAKLRTKYEEFFNEDFVNKNRAFIELVYGDEASELFDDADDGELPEGEIDESAAKTADKEVNIADMLGEDEE